MKDKIDRIFSDLKNEVITKKEAHKQVLDLFVVVVPKCTLVCEKCDEDGWIRENKGDIIESRLCNCSKAN